jgi:sortase (surface protein transpeptidase)
VNRRTPHERRAGTRPTALWAIALLLCGAALLVLGAALVATPRTGVALELPRQPVGLAVTTVPATEAAAPAGPEVADPSTPSPTTTEPLPASVPLSELVPPLPVISDEVAGPTPAAARPAEPAEPEPATEPAEPEPAEPEPVEPEPVEPEPEPAEDEPVEAEPAEPEPATDPVEDDPADVEAAVPTGPVARPTEVEVPAIGVRAPIIELGVDGRGRLEVPSDPQVAGWWTGGAEPGASGPAVIAGHVDSYRGPGVFFRLPELTRGDRIVVRGEDGAVARFAVDRVERWPKDAFPTDAVYRQSDGAELRLITCGGTFDRQALRYLDNIIVFAHAVDDG